MNNLVIETLPDMPYFPEVNFNVDTGVCEICGESYMEDSYKFYAPVKDWITEYSQTGKRLEFHFKLTYFNTSTSRIILEILDLLKKHREAGHQLVINWYFRKSDPDMIDEVEDFQRESEVIINLIELN